jgi:hypothetical protein
LACEANSSGNPAELFPMPGCYPDSSVDQFMAQNRCDFYRHQLFRFTQVRPYKDLKMSVLTALIIPAFAYMPAAPSAGGESNRNTQLGRQRVP